jgi:hypothetical protein
MRNVHDFSMILFLGETCARHEKTDKNSMDRRKQTLNVNSTFGIFVRFLLLGRETDSSPFPKRRPNLRKVRIDLRNPST